MKTVILRSFLSALIAIGVTYVVRMLFKTDTLLSDVSGLSAFASIFGTLYGIITAFVVFEVWGQYSTTVHLIETEAQDWERLYRLTLYLHDNALTAKVKKAIETYIHSVIDDNFKTLSAGARNTQAAIEFRKIAHIVRTIRATSDHEQTVLDHLIDQYGDLAEISTERINQSLARLPYLLKMFLYVTSAIALITFVIMPFANLIYSLFVVSALTFVLVMVLQLIEDLDNPFVGFWNISAEPFQRALDHIDHDYEV